MSLRPETEVQFVKGVGPKLGTLLQKRGIYNVYDLLHYYPRSYEDRRAIHSISSLQPDQLVSLKARVVKVRSIPLGRSKRSMYEVLITDGSGQVSCKFFRAPYKGYFERFQPHQEVRLVGKLTEYKGRKEFHHPDLHPISEEEEIENILFPIYIETEGLSSKKIRAIVEKALELEEKDPFPDWLLKKYELLAEKEALRLVHFPDSDIAEQYLNFRAPAQRRIIFQELFWMEMQIALRRQGLKKEKAYALKFNGDLRDKVIKGLPFQLTDAQLKAIEEIEMDMIEAHPMHRMVQGDVGSGKTLVAFLTAADAMEAGVQAAIMAPTEILAEQHYKNAKKIFEPLGVTVGLLTSQLKAAEKQKQLEDLKSGKIQFMVGTHALIQKDVHFKNLGFVVIDEQHRFGVEQRQELKQKGIFPHFLVMTATPIPRTLAMTVYGDLDVTIINEMPKGRQPIVTRKAFDSKRPQMMEFVREQLKKGRQAYIVYPLIEESEAIDLKNATEEFEKLKTIFSEYKLGLLHGKMKPKEKEEIMNQFRQNEIQVLVSTTVIEVGVDVPNANIILIEHAERFGLAQLHQLRGRVGRGEHKSYCILALGYALSEEAVKRAEIMESTLDGFKIAEQDLLIRGPGEFLGKRQSGLPGFKMANLIRDLPILHEARSAVKDLLAKDAKLAKDEHYLVKRRLEIQAQNWVG